MLGGETSDEAIEAAGDHEAVGGEEVSELFAPSDKIHK